MARRRPAYGAVACEPQLRSQADPLHFAGRALWDFPDDEDPARDLEVGDAPDGELTNVFRRRYGVGAQHDRRCDLLAQRGVRDGKGYGLRHRRVLEEHVVDFLRGDFFPAAIDDLLAAAHEKQVTVVIEKAVVSGLEPIARKRGLVRLRGAVVARHDARAAHYDLPGLSAGQQSSSFAHDCDVQPQRHADRTRLAPARRQRTDRDRRGSGFRHAVKIDHGRFENTLHFRRTGRGRGAVAVRMNRSGQSATRSPVEPSMGENCLEHGRHGGAPCRSKVGQPRKEPGDVTPRGTYDARAGRERGQHRGVETKSIIQGQHIQAPIGFSERRRRNRRVSRRTDVEVCQRDKLGPRRCA